MTVYLNIGTNNGNRYDNINRAIADILCTEIIDPESVKFSDIIESEAWGYESSNDFLNIGISFRLKSAIPPDDILKLFQQIEYEINGECSHRDENGNYLDRILDIDIIAIDEMVYNSPKLVIPHPRMHLRRFVLEPMNQLDRNWVHPIFKKTAFQLMEELNSAE